MRSVPAFLSLPLHYDYMDHISVFLTQLLPNRLQNTYYIADLTVFIFHAHIWVFLSVWDNVLMTSGQLFRNYADSVLEIYGQDLCPKLPN